MPITINGNGAISGLGDIDGHDLETATLVVSGDTTIAPQAVGRASLFVDDSTNSVGINTTTPAAAVFLEVADATDPIVSLNNTGNGEVRLGCGAAEGYIGTESNDSFVLTTNGNSRVRVNTDSSVDFLTNTSSTVTIGPDSGSAFHAHILNSAGDLIVGTQQTSADTILTSQRDLIFRGGSTPTEVLRYDEGLKTGIWNVQAGLETYGNESGGTLVNTDGLIRVNYGNAGTVTYNANNQRTSATGTSALVSYCSAPPGWTDATEATQVGAKVLLLQRNGIINNGRISIDQIAEFTLRKYQVEANNFPRTQLDICLRDTDTLYSAISFTANGKIKLPNAGTAGIQFASYGTGTDVTNNTLDDYEEGVWTPTATFFTSNINARYTKIGRQVTLNIYHFGSGFTVPSNDYQISNLPFTQYDNGTRTAGSAISNTNAIALGAPRSFVLEYNSILKLEPGTYGNRSAMTITYFTAQ